MREKKEPPSEQFHTEKKKKGEGAFRQGAKTDCKGTKKDLRFLSLITTFNYKRIILNYVVDISYRRPV